MKKLFTNLSIKDNEAYQDTFYLIDKDTNKVVYIVEDGTSNLKELERELIYYSGTKNLKVARVMNWELKEENL